MYNYKLPDIGEGLVEGELVEWSVNIDDKVGEGDAVATVSTDKVNVELYAPCSGIIHERLAEPGEVIKVGQVFLRIATDTNAAVDASTKAAHQDDQAGAPAPDLPEDKPAATQRRARLSPAVRRYAQSRDVDIDAVIEATGNDAIVKEDIDTFLAGASRAADDVVVERLSGASLAAAQRLSKSARTMASASISFEINADEMMRRMEEIRPDAAQKSVKVTPLAFIAKALAEALAAHPKLNAVVDDDNDQLVMHRKINLGVAVATPYGLIVPVIRDAGGLNVMELASSIDEIAALARANTLRTSDVKDSTITISSTGGLAKAAITSAMPVINYPNVSTIWFSRVLERPCIADGKVSVGHIVYGTLAFDHRYIHGADAIALVNDIEKNFVG